MDVIHPYRQPMVTATGIFLGFMLNFASGWLPDAFTKNWFKDSVIAIGVLLSFASLFLVLLRILRMKYPGDPARFYRRTLYLLLIGISIPFASMLIIIVRKLILHFIAT